MSVVESSFAIVHSRYSTNTFPQWSLAQPFHMLAPNGEINTLPGKARWAQARQSQMKGGDSGAPPVTASKLDTSELWRRVVSSDHSERMPADSEPLSANQVELLKDWISSGAAFDGEKPGDPLYLVVPPAEFPDPPLKYSVPIPISCVAFSLDGSQVYAGGYHELTCWSTSDGTLLKRIKNIGERVYAISVSPDGTRLAVGERLG